MFDRLLSTISSFLGIGPRPPRNKTECKKMLQDLEYQLIEYIPKLVAENRPKKRAYGILICYPDSTSGWYTPTISILPESYRAECIANRDVSCIWCLPEIRRTAEVALSDEPLAEQCNWVGRYLRAGDGEDEVVLKPFRDMICRVCLKMNTLDWSRFLNVTADFVVMASNNVGGFVKQDACDSVPIAKQKVLRSQGFFFNPEDLPEVAVPPGNPIAQMAQRPAAEQREYWTRELACLIQGKRCDATDANWGTKRIIDALTDLGEPGGDALLAFVERFAEIPERSSKSSNPPCAEDWLPAPRIVFAALKALRYTLRQDDESETRLWRIFDRALAQNEGKEFWGRMPAAVAFAISDSFDAKYDFWVVTDSYNHITSLPQILEQRSKFAPPE